MASERNGSGDHPKAKRMDEMEPEWRIIRARYRGEPYERSEFDDAMAVATAAVDAAAYAVLHNDLRKECRSLLKPLAVNGQRRFWVFMLKPGGGFFKHDGISPIGPYAFKTLEWNCVGRENWQEVTRWGMHGRISREKRRNPIDNSPRKQVIDYRQMPPNFDAADPYWSDDLARRRNANEMAWSLLSELAPDQREALVLRHIEDANLSKEERKRGLPKGFLHRLADRAERNLRQRHPNFEL